MIVSRPRSTATSGRFATQVKGGDRTDRPAPTLETDYTYDPLGNLLTVNQNGVSGGVARKRSFTYDSLSRLACASNPETEPAYTACPTNTTGTLSYTYDANGNVSSKTYTGGTIGTVTYPNLTTTYGNYDGLNRVGLKSYSDGTPSVSYAYDASAVQTTGNLNGGWHRRPPWRAALYFTTTPARVTTSWAGQQDTRSARAQPTAARPARFNRRTNAPTAIYDLKTGGAQLTPARIQQIQANIPGGSNVPIIQIKP